MSSYPDWRTHLRLARTEPSEFLTWSLANWRHLAGTPQPKTAVQIGCGTGRDMLYLAALGIRVLAFDHSMEAIELARERLASSSLPIVPELRLHDLNDGIPGADGGFDLAIDVFVYSELVEVSKRAAYRRELQRVLAPEALLLVVVPDQNDDFFRECARKRAGSASARAADPRVIADPTRGRECLLFSCAGLQEELGGDFDLQMLWRRRKLATVFGKHYHRRSLATIWRSAREEAGGSGRSALEQVRDL